jgi:hypothetical protein
MFCDTLRLVAGKSRRAQLILTREEREQIEQLRDSRTALWREVQRARILWRCHSGENIAEIARAMKMTQKSVGKWISKAVDMGVAAG